MDDEWRCRSGATSYTGDPSMMLLRSEIVGKLQTSSGPTIEHGAWRPGLIAQVRTSVGQEASLIKWLVRKPSRLCASIRRYRLVGLTIGLQTLQTRHPSRCERTVRRRSRPLKGQSWCGSRTLADSDARGCSSGLGLEAQRLIVSRMIGDGELVAEYVEIESGKRSDRPQLALAVRQRL